MYKFIKQGRRHRRLNLACQDAVKGGETAGIVAVTAADASSETNFGREGAEIAVETLLHLLLCHFEEIYEMDKKDIQLNTILQVRNKQCEFCQNQGIGLDDVKSTLMGVAYDKKTKRIIVIHLGDGYIIAKTNGRYRIISYPRNGGNPYRTYLTSTIPVSSKMKVFCGKMEGLQEVSLLTDGWRELFRTEEELIELFDAIKTKRDWEGEDDLGLICCNLDDEQ